MKHKFQRNFSLDAFGHYLHAQTAPPKAPEARPLAITISRETGAGAVTIAELLAQRLQAAEKDPKAHPWTVFDANLAGQVLKDHALPARLAGILAEDTRPPVEAAVGELLGVHPSLWTMVEYTTETVLRLAELGRVILVGRGGNVITARLPNAFHVRLVAPLAARIHHTAEFYELSEAEAAKRVKGKDEARREYVRRYFHTDISDPTLYDLTLNTDRLGFEGAAEIIAHAAVSRYQARLAKSAQARAESGITVPS
jgi:cytidylate kinase